MILMPLIHLPGVVQLHILGHVLVVPLDPLLVPGVLGPLPVHLVPQPVNLGPVDLVDCLNVGVLLSQLPTSPLNVFISISHHDGVWICMYMTLDKVIQWAPDGH